VSARPRTLRRLVALRQRLRDVAGAKAQALEMERLDAVAREEGFREERAGLLENGVPGMVGVRALLLLEDTRVAFDAAIVDAHGVVVGAEERSAQARVAVRQRERELRTTERKLEQVLDELERRRVRDEQRTNDDLSPHRGGRA
jgi:hypothetical protein